MTPAVLPGIPNLLQDRSPAALQEGEAPVWRDPAPPPCGIVLLLLQPPQVNLDPLGEVRLRVPRQHPLGEVPRRRRIRVRRRVRHVRVLPDPRVQAIHRRLLDPVLLRRQFPRPLLAPFPSCACRTFYRASRGASPGGSCVCFLAVVLYTWVGSFYRGSRSNPGTFYRGGR